MSESTKEVKYVMEISSEVLPAYSLWVNIGTVTRMASEMMQSENLAESAKEDMRNAVAYLSEAYLKHGQNIRASVNINTIQ